MQDEKKPREKGIRVMICRVDHEEAEFYVRENQRIGNRLFIDKDDWGKPAYFTRLLDESNLWKHKDLPTPRRLGDGLYVIRGDQVIQVV